MPDFQAQSAPAAASNICDGKQFPEGAMVPVDCLEGHRNWIAYDPARYEAYRCWDCQCVFSV